jgi:hypothetical protein
VSLETFMALPQFTQIVLIVVVGWVLVSVVRSL